MCLRVNFFTLQSLLCPARSFGNHRIGIARCALGDCNEVWISAVADCDQRVSAQPVALRALDWRAPEFLSVFFFRNFCQPRERGIYQPFTRLKFRLVSGWSFSVPRANVL